MLRTGPFFLVACVSCASPVLTRHEFVEPAMGTSFRIVLYAADARTADAAAAAAFARIHELDGRLSDYDEGSELSRLSRASDEAAPTPWIELSRDLEYVLRLSQAQARRTDGAFDVTVGPAVRLWRRARRQAVLPAPERLAAALDRVGYAMLELGAARPVARLLAPGMRLDLGGIAKGFALDEALAVLARSGIERALIDGGGDLRLGRPPPGSSGWKVEIVGTDGLDGTTLQLTGCSLATSGDLERFIDVDGVRYSHLVDPATGYGLTSRLLVSVIAPTGSAADAWASSLSVLGADAGLALLAGVAGIEARIVGPAGDSGAQRVVSETPGFPRAVSSALR